MNVSGSLFLGSRGARMRRACFPLVRWTSRRIEGLRSQALCQLCVDCRRTEQASSTRSAPIAQSFPSVRDVIRLGRPVRSPETLSLEL